MKTIIKDGHVIDPANSIDAMLDVIIENGVIAGMTQNYHSMDPSDRIISAEGCVVAPGFLDIHMHEDPMNEEGQIQVSIFEDMLRMGVTTVLGGNCGGSAAEPGTYLKQVDFYGNPVNVAMLAGYGWFRKHSGALDKYAKASESQRLDTIKGIEQALQEGCFGVSFGVRYIPGMDEDELLRAAQCCRKYGGFIAAHVRDDADAIFEAVDEIAQIGIRTGVPVQISHIGSMGGFGQMKDLLTQTDAYRANGLDILLDCYPYDAFCTDLGATTYDEGWLERYHCGYDVLEYCEGEYKGRRADRESFERLRNEWPDMLTVCHVMKSEDIELAFSHPSVMVGSDGLLNNGQGHPRAAGSFPRVFDQYVRTGKLSLYEAIRKMTAMPAARLGITHLGNLQKGSQADIVIFDPQKIRDRATFSEPILPPEGIRCVLMKGEMAVEGQQIVNGKLGKAVRKRVLF